MISLSPRPLFLSCLLAVLGSPVQADTVLYATVYDSMGQSEDEIWGKVVAIDEQGQVTDYATGFEWPQGITLDQQGNLFVLDGSDIWKITAPGVKEIVATKPNAFNSWDLAMDADDNLYVTGSDMAGEFIYRFTAASGYTSYDTWAAPNAPTGLFVAPDGALYSAGSDTVLRYDTATGDFSTYYTFTGEHDFYTAFDLAMNAEGEWYFSSAGDGLVLKVSADLTTAELAIASGLSGERGIALDPEGRVLVANWTCGCPDEPNAIMIGVDGQAVVFANLGEVYSPNHLLVVAPIPEPSWAMAVLLGVLAWAGIRQRRKEPRTDG